MAAATPSPLLASTETTNGIKLRRLLVDGGTTALRKVFDGIHPPTKLTTNLHLNNSTLDDLFAKGILSEQQRNRLFPPDRSKPDSKTFDITLLFLLLTEICELSPPPRTGWNHKPQAKNKSLPANLVRIKLFRNKLIHTPETRIDTRLFNDLWKEISGVLVSVGLDQVEIDRLKAERCGEEDYLDVLFKWADREKEIKSMLEEVCQSQTKMQKTQQEHQVLLQDTKTAVEAVCKTQQEHCSLLQDANATLEQAYQSQQVTKSKLETIHQNQTETQETVERARQTQLEVHETLQDNKSKLGEVHQTQTKTQVTVETVRQIQLEDRETLQDSKSKLQALHETQSKAQDTFERFRQIQLEDRETLQDSKSKLDAVYQIQTRTQETAASVEKSQEELVKSFEEVKQAVDSLKEGRDEDRSEEVLRNLAKSEFKGDVEYLVGRYQGGTREWVFNEVENWLDDRSSQNRVMVISANAGMGKSVISAVICKRMQEARRLSGSHFCQHNNARYRNPQLMLQSLACHLSHTLSEYKQALIKQLSRNLGKDLNNMGVEELFALLFKEPLSTVADPGRNMLMVIDGLDESDYQERNELLDVIANQLCKLPYWIRFLCTTRPERNIAEVLKHLNPFLLESDDDKNIEDIKRFLEKRTQRLIKPAKKGAIVEKLVKKSEGLMLYAYFLVSFIEEDVSVLDQGDLDGSLPLAISSVYHSYFKRLENELKKELAINEENFLNLLCAVTASREPMPIDFLSKLLVPNANSLLAMRKVRKAMSSVSSLLPIRDECLHIIHKSVKDWLTDASCYGEHDFVMDAKEGHRILASLCADQLDHLKQKGARDAQFSSTEKYALNHGVRHMLQLDEDMGSRSLEECVQTYVIDLELLYAKLCINTSTAAEEIVWIQSQELCRALSAESKDLLNTLIFLLRKYFSTFTDHPHVFLQTVLNEGGSVLSLMASNMLQNKYPEIPHMEFVHKDKQQGAVLARFQCSSQVACFDVSPQLDYMVCECDDGTIQLWSLHTGKLLWTCPVKVKKRYFLFRRAHRVPSPSSDVLSFYRSVVFHPTEEVVLPGVLSHAYDFNGELKPLFPESNCSFTVCSISGDKTTILTDCPDDAKCIVMWNLKNGSEITRTTRNEDVLSFAWSRDGKLLAICHVTGFISIVDVVDGFKTVGQTAPPVRCGMIKFSSDCRSLFCWCVSPTRFWGSPFRLNINIAKHATFLCERCERPEFESRSEGGFLLGDPLPRWSTRKKDDFFGLRTFHFALDERTVLRAYFNRNYVEMLRINEREETVKEVTYTTVKEIVFSLSGEIIYVLRHPLHGRITSKANVSAWNVSSSELIVEKNFKLCLELEEHRSKYLLAVKGGLLLITGRDILEMWNFELSKCVRSWTNIPGMAKMIPVSEERVAFATEERKLIILDTTSGEIVSTIPFVCSGYLLACNSKFQLLTWSRGQYNSLHLSDGETTLWKKQQSRVLWATFSPAETFVIIFETTELFMSELISGVHVLDAVSGKPLHILCRDMHDCNFVSDEECVITSDAVRKSVHLQLFNVRSGDSLSTIDLERNVRFMHVAACPRKRLLAIDQSDSQHGFQLIQIHLPRDKDSRKRIRVLNTGDHKKIQVGEQEVCSCLGMNDDDDDDDEIKSCPVYSARSRVFVRSKNYLVTERTKDKMESNCVIE